MPNQGRNRGQITATGNTALAASQIAIGAGWGADSTVAIGTGSNDVAGKLTISTVVGAGAMAQATATVVITYASAYAVAPRACIATSTNTNSLGTAPVWLWSSTTTALTLTCPLLPVTAKDYVINYALIA